MSFPCPHCGAVVDPPKGWRPETLEAYRAERRAAFIRAARDWYEQTEEAPSQRMWKAHRPVDSPSLSAVCNLFGSWNKALAAAGLPHRKPSGPGRGPQLGRNRQMVTGRAWTDSDPGTIKHYSVGGRAAA